MIPHDLSALLKGHGWQELAGTRIKPVTGGMSGALLFHVTEPGKPSRYLKIARDKAVTGLRQEIERTRWLAARSIRVPGILRVEDGIDQVAVLTQAVPGMQAEQSPLAVSFLTEALAHGLAALHGLPPAGCPFDESLGVRLSRAAEAVASGEVTPEDFEPRNRGIAPEVLLERLMTGRPTEDIVVVHGDATLTNLIVDTDGTLGFVDCGNAGRGDRYIDLAVLAGEIEERFGVDAAARFIKAYGLVNWDSAKARYFSDLYELF